MIYWKIHCIAKLINVHSMWAGSVSPHPKWPQISINVKPVSIVPSESTFLRHKKLHHDDASILEQGTLNTTWAQASAAGQWGGGTITLWQSTKQPCPCVITPLVAISVRRFDLHKILWELNVFAHGYLRENYFSFDLSVVNSTLRSQNRWTRSNKFYLTVY